MACAFILVRDRTWLVDAICRLWYVFRFSIVMHVFDYSLLDRKDTFSNSKRGNGRRLKLLEVLGM